MPVVFRVQNLPYIWALNWCVMTVMLSMNSQWVLPGPLRGGDQGYFCPRAPTC